MKQYILKDPKHIDAAIVDIDNNALANRARDELAEKHGARGHKTVMSAQYGSMGVEVMTVTMLKFRGQLPAGFVGLGDDKDGSTLALPDFRTAKGEAIGQEMADLPRFSRQLSQAMGMSAKIMGGKVSYGIAGIEEIGRQIVVKTSHDVPADLNVLPVSSEEYSDLRQSTQRAQSMAKSSAPTPFGR